MSVVVYDNQIRTLLQTDQQYPSVMSQRGVQANEDGSYDIYFGPTAPEGKEKNWTQTVPGKGFFLILRLYGPLKPWFEQTWRTGKRNSNQDEGEAGSKAADYCLDIDEEKRAVLYA